MTSIIAENVVFVEDGEGHRYYIPKDNLEEWDYYIDSEHFLETGIAPDWAVPIDGAEFVVDIREVL